MAPLLIFLIFVAVLYVISNGSLGPTLVSSFKSLSNYLFSGLEEVKELEKDLAGVKLPASLTKPEEVFHVPNQQFTYNEAKQFCAAIGVRMATLNEVKKAYLQGAQWATMGWTDGRLGLYVLQPQYVRRHPNSGEIGVNGGYFENPNVRMGINCYGVKPEPDPSRIEYSYSELGEEIDEVDEDGVLVKKGGVYGKIDYSKMLKDGQIVIGPWNDNKWSMNSKKESQYHLYDVDIQSKGVTGEAQKQTDSEEVNGNDEKWVFDKKSEVSRTEMGTGVDVKTSISGGNRGGVVSVASNMNDTDYSTAVASLSRSHIQSLLK